MVTRDGDEVVYSLPKACPTFGRSRGRSWPITGRLNVQNPLRILQVFPLKKPSLPPQTGRVSRASSSSLHPHSNRLQRTDGRTDQGDASRPTFCYTTRRCVLGDQGSCCDCGVGVSQAYMFVGLPFSSLGASSNNIVWRGVGGVPFGRRSENPCLCTRTRGRRQLTAHRWPLCVQKQ